MSPVETYASVILHSGCAIPPKGETESRLHKWDECRGQKFFLRMARKHQHKLKSSGVVIGKWVNEKHYKAIKHDDLAAHLGHRMTVYYGPKQSAVLDCKDDGAVVE